MEMLKQDPLTAVAKPLQAILLALPFTTFLQDKNSKFVEKYKPIILNAFIRHPQLIPITKAVSKLKTDEELIKLLEGVGGILAKICPS